MSPRIRFLIELIPLLIICLCLSVAFFAPGYYLREVIAKDGVDAIGYVENLTVIFLITGIAVGLWTLVANWSRMPFAALRVGLILWIAGCVFFAGEEISWGQWIFKWETPEIVREVNKQNETNFHNSSSWFNEKPRAMVEIWFVVSGLGIALLRRFGKLRFPVHDWREWLNPYSLGISAALVFLFSKIGGSLPLGVFTRDGGGEFREMIIAYFLSIYLVSLFFRLREEDMPEAKKTSDTVTAESEACSLEFPSGSGRRTQC